MASATNLIRGLVLHHVLGGSALCTILYEYCRYLLQAAVWANRKSTYLQRTAATTAPMRICKRPNLLPRLLVRIRLENSLYFRLTGRCMPSRSTRAGSSFPIVLRETFCS